LKIRGEKPCYVQLWDSLDYNKKAIIHVLIDRVYNAAKIDDLVRVSSCHEGRGLYFIYNHVGKLYFQHHVTENEITLLKITFANHDPF